MKLTKLNTASIRVVVFRSQPGIFGMIIIPSGKLLQFAIENDHIEIVDLPIYP